MRDPTLSHHAPTSFPMPVLGTHHDAVLAGAALPQRLQQLVYGSVGKPHRGGCWGQRHLEQTGTLTSCPQGASHHIPTAGELTSIPKYWCPLPSTASTYSRTKSTASSSRS